MDNSNIISWDILPGNPYSYDEKECSICLIPINVVDCVITKCGHGFCLPCLTKNFSRNNNSPSFGMGYDLGISNIDSAKNEAYRDGFADGRNAADAKYELLKWQYDEDKRLYDLTLAQLKGYTSLKMEYEKDYLKNIKKNGNTKEIEELSTLSILHRSISV